MAVVRYVALAALVVWMGALAGGLEGGGWPNGAAIEIGCGLLLTLALLTIKFMGPPPRAFSIRLPIVLAMLVVSTLDWRYGPSRALALGNLVMGFGLLGWYARE